jgi:transcriptional regulator with XRE-family HTH domain
MQVQLNAAAIRRILAEKNRTQNWLAQRVGTTSGYMSQMLAGHRHPSPKMRRAILKVLKGYDFKEIFVLPE